MQGTYKDIAELLGVTSNQVYAWHKRARTTGFPEPEHYVSGHGDLRLLGAPEFDFEKVLRWHENYVPKRGGAPLGNTNAANRHD